MAPRVLVTGPSGFIGAHVFSQLIEKSYSVRGTVRTEAKADFFKKKYPDADMDFVIVEDIAQQGAFKDAVKGELTSVQREIVDVRCRLYYSRSKSFSFQYHGL
jgi:nucleoside-diphosphate-sugar epimerase